MVIKKFSACTLFLLLSLCLASCQQTESDSNVDSDVGTDDGCDDCHGFPPIPPCDELVFAHSLGSSSPQFPGGPLVDVYLPRRENYPGGGGAHRVHVSFLRNQIVQAGGEPTIEDLCGPCHGSNPGEAPWHNGSGVDDDGAWAWPLSRQAEVDIVDGRGNFGASAQYNGEPVLTGVGAKGGEPQQCDSFNCHGAAAPYNATPFGDEIYSNGFSRFEPEYPNSMRLLWDFACEDYANDQSDESVYDEWSRDIACAGCHGHNPDLPDLRTRIVVENTLPDAAGPFYDSDSPNPLPHGVAANYFGTVSGYARGGHGDAGIQNEDTFVDSAVGISTPLRCTACHDSEADHFPVSEDNIHRLRNQVIEDETHEAGLCNECHLGDSYPSQHHPSYYKPAAIEGDPNVPIVPADQQEIYTVSSAWIQVGNTPQYYLQDGYSASEVSGYTDFFVDFWGALPGLPTSPTPQPQPFAVLPLENEVYGFGSSNRVMCVTCHNPHGTDLFPYDDGSQSGFNKNTDSNMLRVRDEDMTLCLACH